jgi:Ni/Fe-hydrogenase subunit HybB-like protein
MGALPNKTGKRGSVVPIEAARRRLRAAQARPQELRVYRPILIIALLIALVALLVGIWIGLTYASHGDYDSAFVAPLWIVLPGLVPLAVCYLRRRWPDRERGEPPPVRSFGEPRQNLRRQRPRR